MAKDLAYEQARIAYTTIPKGKHREDLLQRAPYWSPSEENGRGGERHKAECMVRWKKKERGKV